MLLTVATSKQCSFDICKATFRDLRRLGFSNLQMKYDYTILYANYCGDQGYPREGIRVLKHLINDLHKEKPVPRQQAFTHVEERIEDLRHLQEMKTKKGKKGS